MDNRCFGDVCKSLETQAPEKAAAQIEKDKADLATAQRNLERQQELFRQKFIAQAALDTVQNSVDTLKGQLALDTAAYEAARVEAQQRALPVDLLLQRVAARR